MIVGLFVCIFNASLHLCVDEGNGFDILLVMYGELVRLGTFVAHSVKS